MVALPTPGALRHVPAVLVLRRPPGRRRGPRPRPAFHAATQPNVHGVARGRRLLGSLGLGRVPPADLPLRAAGQAVRRLHEAAGVDAVLPADPRHPRERVLGAEFRLGAPLDAAAGRHGALRVAARRPPPVRHPLPRVRAAVVSLPGPLFSVRRRRAAAGLQARLSLRRVPRERSDLLLRRVAGAELPRLSALDAVGRLEQAPRVDAALAVEPGHPRQGVPGAELALAALRTAARRHRAAVEAAVSPSAVPAPFRERIETWTENVRRIKNRGRSRTKVTRVLARVELKLQQEVGSTFSGYSTRGLLLPSDKSSNYR